LPLSAFAQFDQVEIGPDILSPLAARFFQEMLEAPFLFRCVGVTGNHRFIPLLAFFVGVLNSILAQPPDKGVVIQLIRRLLEGIRIDSQEGEQMLVKTDRLVVVAMKQTLTMQPSLIDQACEVDVTSEPLIRTPRESPRHRVCLRSRRHTKWMWRRLTQ